MACCWGNEKNLPECVMMRDSIWPSSSIQCLYLWWVTLNTASYFAIFLCCLLLLQSPCSPSASWQTDRREVAGETGENHIQHSNNKHWDPPPPEICALLSALHPQHKWLHLYSWSLQTTQRSSAASRTALTCIQCAHCSAPTWLRLKTLNANRWSPSTLPIIAILNTLLFTVETFRFLGSTISNEPRCVLLNSIIRKVQQRSSKFLSCLRSYWSSFTLQWSRHIHHCLVWIWH